MQGTLSFVGWFVLPTLLTTFVQTVYYRIITPVGEPRPLRKSARYRRDHRKIFKIIIICYLLFTIFEAFYNVMYDPKSNMASNNSLYSVLEIKARNLGSITPTELRGSFRKLSLKYHPDKVAAAAASAQNAGRAGKTVNTAFSLFSSTKTQDYTSWSSEKIEGHYIRIKAAYDVLSNPVTRFGYDRFGPLGIKWARKFDALLDTANSGDRTADNSIAAATMLEFVVLGLRNSALSFYVGSFAAVLVMYLIGYPKTGHTWRIFATCVGLFIELFMITRPLSTIYYYFPIMGWLGLLPYQMVSVIHSLLITSYIALNQLGPLVSGDPENEGSEDGGKPKDPNTVAAALAGVPGVGMAGGGGVIPPLSSTRGQAVLQKQLEFLEQLTDNITHESTQAYRHQMLPFSGNENLVKEVNQATVEALVERKLMDDVEVRDAVQEVTPLVRATIQAERTAIAHALTLASSNRKSNTRRKN